MVKIRFPTGAVLPHRCSATARTVKTTFKEKRKATKQALTNK